MTVFALALAQTTAKLGAKISFRIMKIDAHRLSPSRARLFFPLLLAAGMVGLAYGLRLGLIEQPRFAWACQSTLPPWWCPLRTAVIESLRFGVLGLGALAFGLIALLQGGPRVALAAIGLGAAGLVLYAPELSAGGALLGAMALVRR